jgi:ABC-type transporter Mla subunit MlaD
MLVRDWFLKPATDLLHSLQRTIVMNQAETLELLNSTLDTLNKVGGETTQLLGEVQALKDALANAGSNTPEVDAALAALAERAAAIDGMVPDAP